ncbi:hypothetical protein BZA77DRAFT_293625 [Pyronema omphalodes]|nr:hypothetical protein BZA77DRAFT_293625 [Pyronema omphalodes]
MDADDAFTIFAGVSELLGLALKTAKILQDYIDNIQPLPEEARNLLTEITALCQTLEKLMDFLRNDHTGNFTETSALPGAMGACKIQITKLYEIIEKSKATSEEGAIKKEIEEEDYRNTISTFKSFTEMFRELLTKTSEEVLAELKARKNEMEQTLESFRLMQLPGIDELLTASKQQTEILGDVIKILELGQQTQENANIMATGYFPTNLSIGTGSNFKLTENLDEEMQSLLKWISPLNPQTKHTYLRSKRVQNTGNWFLETEEFQNWRDGSDRIKILGCYGIPGAGKTFISSLVIDHLFSRSAGGNTCVLFVYCDYRVQKERNVSTIIKELLKQAVMVAKKNNPHIIQRLLNRMRSYPVILYSEALHVISLLLRGFDKIYICIDGLDECNERDRRLLVQYLVELSSSNRSNPLSIRFFFTGSPAMEEYVKSHTAVAPLIPVAMRLEANPEDVAAYIARRIEEDKLVQMDDGFKKHIIREIASASQGMFLLPTLQIEAILHEPTIRKRRKALQDTPKDLYDAYGITLDRIKAQKQSLSSLAMKVLQWVFLTTRPLSVEELRHALAVEPGDTELHKDNFVEPHLILDCCLGLVIVDESTSTVRLVHQSLHNYFQQQYDKGLLFSNGHMEIASICMTYTAFDVFNSHVKTFADTIFPHLDTHLETETCEQAINTLKSTMFTPYPFLYYAVAQWDNHFRSSKTRDPVVEDMAFVLIMEKYTSNIAPRYLFTPRLINWEGFHHNFEDEFYYRIRCYREAWKWTTESFPVHIAASTGSLELFRRVAMAVNGDINAMDAWGNLALTLAAGTGNLSLVQSILDPPYNADVNATCYSDSASADLNTKDNTHGRTPLIWSFYKPQRWDDWMEWIDYRNFDTLKALLSRQDIDVNWKPNDGSTALSRAIELEFHEAEELLRAHGAV